MMSQVEGPTWPLLGEAGEEEEDGGKTLIKSSQGGRESEPSNIWLSMKILPVQYRKQILEIWSQTWFSNCWNYMEFAKLCSEAMMWLASIMIWIEEA